VIGRLTIIKITRGLLRFLIVPPLILYSTAWLKYGGVKGGWESIYEMQGGVRKKVVRRPKSTAKEAA
jgi:hypothetical protein